MIGNRKRLVPPGNRLLNNIPDIRNPVHIAHLRMAVQLHALLGAGVHPPLCKIRNFFYPGNRAKRQLTVKAVKRRYALDL